MTNKKTREIIRNFVDGNRLRRYVVNDIISDSDNYNGANLAERIAARLKDVSYGCSSGTVSSLVYYSETTAFFKKFKQWRPTD